MQDSNYVNIEYDQSHILVSQTLLSYMERKFGELP